MRRCSVAIAAVLVTAAGSACRPPPPSFAITHREQRGTLTHNGLRFVVMPDPTTSLVHVAVRYDVGSAADPAGKSGLAHLVEHLMFDVRPEGEVRTIASYLTQLGLSWNAYTNQESTHYMTLAAAGKADALLQLEAMRLYYGCRTIPEPEFQREREVVRNELRQRADSAEALIEPALIEALYPAGHPYAHRIGGTDAELARLTLADACAFMAAHYTPAHATVIVAGGVEVEPTVASIDKWFGKLDHGAAVATVPAPPVTLRTTRTTIDLDIDRPVVAVSWALPPTHRVVDEAVRYRIVDRLGAAVGHARQYGAALRGSMLELGGHDAPVLTLLLELEHEGDVDDAVRFAMKAAAQPEQDFIEDLADVRSRFKTGFLMQLERLERRAIDVADLMQFRPDLDLAGGKPVVFAELDAIDRLDLAAAEAEARRATRPDAAQVTVFRPTKTAPGERRGSFDFTPPPHDFGELEVDPAEARRRLELGAEPDRLAGAKRIELDNGLVVVLLADADAPVPVVSVELSIGAGEAAAPDHPMVPVATATLVQTPPRAAYEMWRAGIGLGCRTTPDHTICRGQTVSIYLSELLVGLERRLRAGRYDQRAIEQWQQVSGDLARRRRQREDAELERQELAAVFGPEHPYTRSGVAIPGGERGFGQDRLIAFRDAHYGAANTTLVVVGAFDPARAEATIRDAFGGWPRGTVDAPVDPAPRARTGAIHVGVVREARPQATLAISFPSPAGIDGQQAARLVLTEMLRGVTADVRESLGASYGVGVWREERRGPTRYEVRTDVDAARAGEALVALRAGLAALRAGDGFDVRFVRARRRVVERMVAESTVSSERAYRLGTLARFGLRPDYYRQLLRQVAALSTGQLAALIASELAESGEVIVAMADRPTLTAAFAAAGITDATLVEP